MIPFKPESLLQLQARYKAAIQKTWDIANADETTRPGNQRAHVFDCNDGIRIIISKDRDHITNKYYLHFSCSIDEKTFTGIMNKKLIDKFVERFNEISGRNEKFPVVTFFTPKGIPHWLIPILD